jgi:hypothetical protein
LQRKVFHSMGNFRVNKKKRTKLTFFLLHLLNVQICLIAVRQLK